MTKFNDNFLRACRREPVDHTPVWFMRQAGRYQPEYRKIKDNKSIHEIIQDPDLCAQVTKLPIEQLGVDAAILFSDIMTPIGPMGIENEIRPNYGPYVPNPIRTPADVQRIEIPDFESATPYVRQTIEQLVNDLNVPLIGFCGAPFTLASYIIEGGKSKHYENTKALMYNDPDTWHALMDKLVDGMIGYLSLQINAGAHAIQVFDSWVGALGQSDYQTYIHPHMAKLFDAIQGYGVPRILFGVHTLHLLGQMKDTGCDVVGVDWRVDIGVAWQIMEYKVGIMGNLDPVSVLGPWDVIEHKVKSILDSINHSGQEGFIFNLGHGVIPSLSADKLKQIVDYVHGY